MDPSELLTTLRISDAARQGRHCDRRKDEIAAPAGLSRRLVQNALREAARLGLVTVEERRREGRRNLPNVVRIVSREWTAWLTKAPRSARPSIGSVTGCKRLNPRLGQI